MLFVYKMYNFLNISLGLEFEHPNTYNILKNAYKLQELTKYKSN